MSSPQSYKVFRRTVGDAPRSIELVTETVPDVLDPQDVLIKIHAVSLNYRDVAMLQGTYPVQTKERGVPASDCGAEVVAVGSEVKNFRIGDHVTPIFDLNNINGGNQKTAALGGDVDGVLRQFAVFHQNVLVQVPKHLSWEEVACITCGGTTAWTALDMPRNSGTALLQGTGGVSMFSLLICLAAGIRPIITSASDKKLEMAKAIGKPDAVDTINYSSTPRWDEEALRLTNGEGVDVVVDNVGITSVEQSLHSLRRWGTVSLVGFLGGFTSDKQPDIMRYMFMKSATMRGIAVGSKKDQQDLCDFLGEKKVDLKPMLDETTFSFENSQAAFDHLLSGKHVGKVIIKM